MMRNDEIPQTRMHAYAFGKNMTPVQQVSRVMSADRSNKLFQSFLTIYYLNLPVPINDFNNKKTAFAGVAVP